MPSKGKRSRRRERNRSGSDETQPQAAAPSTATKRDRRPRSRKSRTQSKNSPIVMLGIGGAVVVLVLIGAAFFQVSRGAGGVSDFSFSVYQGEDVLGGSNINFQDLIDQGKPIVLNFWAGDCPPCRAEMPALQKVYDKHQEDIIFVGLDVGTFTGLGTRQSALALLKELNITYPAGGPPGRTPMTNYSVVSMPTTIFIGSDGKLFQRRDGTINEAQMNAVVESMIDQAS